MSVRGWRVVRPVTVLFSGGVAAAGLLVAAVPAQARAEVAALSCGTTITHSVTLTRNINCATSSAQSAITIGAAGITVNLNGHKITGPGDIKGTVGILDNGEGNVTIESGTISNFFAGVEVAGTTSKDLTGLVVKNITVTDNTLGDLDYGVFGSSLSGARFSGLSIKNADEGIELDTSQRCTVTKSDLATPTTGLLDMGGDGNTFSYNVISGAIQVGIYIERDNPNDTNVTQVVTHNKITGGVSAVGILAADTYHLSITRNELTGLNTGMDLSEDIHAAVTSNTGSGNGWGIHADSATLVTYTSNTFSNGQYGIETDTPYNETLKTNTTNDNSVAGVYITTSQTGYPVTLIDNTANKNEFGLYSQIHTTGSGNHAAHNTVLNCHNVKCV
jgi:hypothetical protein